MEFERKFSRREILLFSAGLLTIKCLGDGNSGSETHGSESDLEKNIEEKYKIELISNEEGANIREGHPNRKLKLPSSWDFGRINALDNTLSQLPHHFYEPIDNETLLIEAVSVEWDKAGNCWCSQYDEIPQIISINAPLSLVYPGGEEESLRIITHELIHRITPEDQNGRSSWYSAISKIMGKNNFEEVSKDINDELLKLLIPLPSGNGYTLESFEMGIFYNSMRYALKIDKEERREDSEHESEFWPVLSEYYVKGKDVFSEYMSKITSQGKVDLLYSFIKDEIFRGKEY